MKEPSPSVPSIDVQHEKFHCQFLFEYDNNIKKLNGRHQSQDTIYINSVYKLSLFKYTQPNVIRLIQLLSSRADRFSTFLYNLFISIVHFNFMKIQTSYPGSNPITRTKWEIILRSRNHIEAVCKKLCIRSQKCFANLLNAQNCFDYLLLRVNLLKKLSCSLR